MRLDLLFRSIRRGARVSGLCYLIAILGLATVLSGGLAAGARAQDQTYSTNELTNAAHRFFGSTSSALASMVERAASNHGLPNGYLLGEEGSGAFFGGLRYGEGVLYTKNAGNHKVFWQGPTLGLDMGADGARTMMLVYNLPSVDAIYSRYGGVEGSLYFVGGFGMTALRRGPVYVVPIRTGIGMRAGFNLGYLKFTSAPTWNPF